MNPSNNDYWVRRELIRGSLIPSDLVQINGCPSPKTSLFDSALSFSLEGVWSICATIESLPKGTVRNSNLRTIRFAQATLPNSLLFNPTRSPQLTTTR